MFGVVGEHEGSEECSACGYSCGDETSGVESLKVAARATANRLLAASRGAPAAVSRSAAR